MTHSSSRRCRFPDFRFSTLGGAHPVWPWNCQQDDNENCGRGRAGTALQGNGFIYPSGFLLLYGAVAMIMRLDFSVNCR